MQQQDITAHEAVPQLCSQTTASCQLRPRLGVDYNNFLWF